MANVIPSRCFQCDRLCEGVVDCIQEYCITANVVIVIFNAVISVGLFSRLFLFIKRSGFKFTLKKLIFACGWLFTLLRTIRYVMVLASIQYHGLAGRLVDTIVFWWAFALLELMYASLLAFWGRVCDKKIPPTSVFGRRRVAILVVSSVIVTILVFILPFVTAFGGDTADIACNALIAVVILALTIGFLVEGIKMYRFVQFMTEGPKQIAKLTNITISATSSLGFVLMVIVVSTVVRKVLYHDNFVACQTFQLFLRGTELLLVTCVTWPLRMSKKGNDSSSDQSGSARAPKSAAISNQIPSNEPIKQSDNNSLLDDTQETHGEELELTPIPSSNNVE
eukprot:TRINITY_DN15664_c0_g1_i1.p1 TRINITY_DN15664_c0_g1~~TRINITY_DN15664_c0_g1_i1.p1  ORF type:complete len:347 (+),score=30.25 TRINITY_DN15664_c0_g1_i1:33-1043(+)